MSANKKTAMVFVPIFILACIAVLGFNIGRAYRDVSTGTHPIVHRPSTADAMRATVRIRAVNGTGTGVVVAERTVLTAAHVIEGSAEVVVDIFSDTGYLPLRGTVLGCDKDADLALVRVAEILPQPVILGLGLCADLRAGAPCVAIGATAGHTPHNMTAGFFSGKLVEDVRTRMIQGQPYCRPGLWQVSCAGFPGNSGCGVYSEGQLIGICITGDSYCTMYVVPVTEVAAYLKENLK